MLVDLTFDESGRIATLTDLNTGLRVAEFLVHGPFKRNAESVAAKFDDTFFGEIRGIGDNEVIDRRKLIIRKVD